MEEADLKLAIVIKYKILVGEIREDENITVFYPYSATSGAAPITLLPRIPNIFIELKRYFSTLKLPPKGYIVYGHIYIGTNIEYKYWNSNFLE